MIEINEQTTTKVEYPKISSGTLFPQVGHTISLLSFKYSYFILNEVPQDEQLKVASNIFSPPLITNILQHSAGEDKLKRKEPHP